MAQELRADAPVEVEERPGLLEVGHACVHRVPREPQALGERDDRAARVLRERDEEIEVDGIVAAHSVQPIPVTRSTLPSLSVMTGAMCGVGLRSRYPVLDEERRGARR
ncbi:hypothetical protein D3C74_420690 [compost metagenome]